MEKNKLTPPNNFPKFIVFKWVLHYNPSQKKNQKRKKNKNRTKSLNGHQIKHYDDIFSGSQKILSYPKQSEFCQVINIS